MRLALLLATVLAVACVKPIVRPTPVSGAGCASAAARLSELNCTIAHDFEARCEKAADRGIRIATECIAGATSCEQVPKCR